MRSAMLKLFPITFNIRYFTYAICVIALPSLFSPRPIYASRHTNNVLWRRLRDVDMLTFDFIFPGCLAELTYRRGHAWLVGTCVCAICALHELIGMIGAAEFWSQNMSY
jgi:hypothetical protein